jgi:hypothetical protein
MEREIAAWKAKQSASAAKANEESNPNYLTPSAPPLSLATAAPSSEQPISDVTSSSVGFFSQNSPDAHSRCSCTTAAAASPQATISFNELSSALQSFATECRKENFSQIKEQSVPSHYKHISADKISLEVIKVPVRVHGTLLDLEQILQFHKGPNGQLIHPLTSAAFGPQDIYPDCETTKTLRAILEKQMQEQGHEQKQENHEQPAHP